ncbi:hypothetical protein B9Z55_004474 [Caenorhabditis nigoni]|uniref:Uncharacterized protein n=1 Tax=Caenorhabditis nigoni TaxID=1611254 RepID=A0A2G5UWJ4_9PELO|nr:hypothetical protein B9Z55_004474 [Caenorhabditis nigoni]
MQRVIEHSTPAEQEAIKNYIGTDNNALCLDKSACRVVQTALETQERSTSSSAHNNQKLIDKSIGAVKKTGITTKDGAYSLVETPNETSHSSSRDVSGPESSGANVIQIPVRAGITAEQVRKTGRKPQKLPILTHWKTPESLVPMHRKARNFPRLINRSYVEPRGFQAAFSMRDSQKNRLGIEVNRKFRKIWPKISDFRCLKRLPDVSLSCHVSASFSLNSAKNPEEGFEKRERCRKIARIEYEIRSLERRLEKRSSRV